MDISTSRTVTRAVIPKLGSSGHQGRKMEPNWKWGEKCLVEILGSKPEKFNIEYSTQSAQGSHQLFCKIFLNEMKRTKHFSYYDNRSSFIYPRITHCIFYQANFYMAIINIG